MISFFMRYYREMINGKVYSGKLIDKSLKWYWIWIDIDIDIDIDKLIALVTLFFYSYFSLKIIFV